MISNVFAPHFRKRMYYATTSVYLTTNLWPLASLSFSLLMPKTIDTNVYFMDNGHCPGDNFNDKEFKGAL
jgi:hypothetical protein